MRVTQGNPIKRKGERKLNKTWLEQIETFIAKYLLRDDFQANRMQCERSERKFRSGNKKRAFDNRMKGEAFHPQTTVLRTKTIGKAIRRNSTRCVGFHIKISYRTKQGSSQETKRWMKLNAGIRNPNLIWGGKRRKHRFLRRNIIRKLIDGKW